MSEDRAGYVCGRIEQLTDSDRWPPPPPPNRTIDQYGAAVEPSITAKEIRRISEIQSAMADRAASNDAKLGHTVRAEVLKELADMMEAGI